LKDNDLFKLPEGRQNKKAEDMIKKEGKSDKKKVKR